MNATVFVCLLTFMGGALLAVAGTAAAMFAECPALVTQFPSPGFGCNLFTALVFSGSVIGVGAALVGAAAMIIPSK